MLLTNANQCYNINYKIIFFIGGNFYIKNLNIKIIKNKIYFSHG